MLPFLVIFAAGSATVVFVVRRRCEFGVASRGVEGNQSY
jgi:hypothetical protein